eukprot:5687349-Pleurochrysis_carterae.AAC.2
MSLRCCARSSIRLPALYANCVDDKPRTAVSGASIVCAQCGRWRKRRSTHRTMRVGSTKGGGG